MTSSKLEYAERRMQQKWYDLVTAEQQGASPQTLERMLNAYMLAVEDYNRCSASQEASPVPAEPAPATPAALPPSRKPTTTSRATGRRKKAS